MFVRESHRANDGQEYSKLMTERIQENNNCTIWTRIICNQTENNCGIFIFNIANCVNKNN